jgi:hypothetical protein
MKLIATGIAVAALAAGMVMPVQARIGGIAQDIANLPHQSAPGCARNPPPSQC